MIRTYDAHGFRRIPAGEFYPGFTALRVDDSREIAAMGCGPYVEKALQRRVDGVKP